MEIQFGFVIGDPNEFNEKDPISHLYTSWRQYLDGICTNIPDDSFPKELIDVNERLVKLTENIKASKDESEYLLEISKYKFIIDDLWLCYKNLNWAPLFPGDYWSFFEYENMKMMHLCLFDKKCSKKWLASNKTIILFYFGHGNSTGDWNISKESDSGSWKFTDFLEKFVNTVETDDISNLNLIIVSDSCFSGKIINILKTYFKKTINCLSTSILQRRNIVIAFQAACSSEELSYNRYFSVLFSLLQHPEHYEFYITIKQLLLNNGTVSDSRYFEDDCLIFRPIQTPQYYCEGNKDCIESLKQTFNFFDQKDAIPLRMFWEFYAFKTLRLSVKDLLNFYPKIKIIKDCQDYCIKPTLKDRVNGSERKDFLQKLLNAPIEDIITYTAGKDKRGFILLETVDDKQYSIHLHCKPNVKQSPDPHNNVEVEFLLEEDTTYKISEFVPLYFKNYSKGTAFRIKADSKLEAIQFLKNSFSRISEQQLNKAEIIPIKLTNKISYFLIVTNYETDCVDDEKPYFDKTSNIRVFLIPKHKYFQELQDEVKTPLIESSQIKDYSEWLKNMLQKCNNYLHNHLEYHILYKNPGGIAQQSKINDWFKEIEKSFARGSTPMRFNQWDWYGSLMASFNIRLRYSL